MSSTEWDVVVAGASIAGNSAARRLAEEGCRVVVIEDDLEVGTPEKCGGLVSLESLEQMGIPPSSRIISDNMLSAIFASHGGEVLELDARKVGVVALKRRELDKAVAKYAASEGARYELGSKVQAFEEKGDAVEVSASTGRYRAKYLIDARGVSIYNGLKPGGLLSAVQYECTLPDLKRGRVEVVLDKEVSEEYFAWVIPLDDSSARVGIAGRGPGLQTWLEGYIAGRGGQAIKRTFASIVVGGPLDRFVYGRRILAGDAAGQSKPTTGGGIFSGGVGGMMAGSAVAEAVRQGNQKPLQGYEREWRGQFQKDFDTQLAIRRLYEDLSNEELDSLFSILIREKAAEHLKDGSFDYHALDLAKMLGAKGLLDSLLVLGGSYRRIRSLVDLVR
ncbi:MAG TPA: NAD(P)/FAD-dependent oxidoreductase [Conexivisphaerales archaeon]|nr:NAD(P)/FAD-dependent oxidoreductase [Conexivisphaerales archaeon]